MAHQLHLEKEKYRQWVKAGLGLGYLKEGLAPFCDHVAKQHHKDILKNVKQTKNLQTVACGHCALRTLKPDHVKTGKNQCSFGQDNCNCCYTSGKLACPNDVCGAIYDTIITYHASTPPAPNWKNTQTQQWTGDPWSICKCFINVPGYGQNTSAADTDCTGLLHVIINNKYFHNQIACKIAGTDVFSKVRQYRNKIFHSNSMELEQKDANSYIDDMIAILEDGKVLRTRKYAQDAVEKLKELKKDDFIITTKSEADVVHDAVKTISDTIEEYENKLRDKLEHVPTTKDVDDKLREKLANVPTTKDMDDKLREKLENVPTTKDMDDKLREKLESLPTTDDFAGLETRVKTLELDMAKEMKQLKAAQSFQRDQYDYIKSKLEFQKKIMSDYRQSLLQVSAIPLKPERKHCNFSEVYVRPKMTYERQDENRRPKETEIQSMSEFFIKAGHRLKSIYVLGDAGSGKSSFCRSLINSWCVAQSEEPIIEDEFDSIKEMKNIEFLFYIALRRYKDVVSIHEMLSKQYKSEILNEILNKESRNIIILLDGLDEWSCRTETSNQFQTEGLPERDSSVNYTVITTSRPWKIETLRITDQEMDLRVNLTGFDDYAVETMIDKTVPILNATFVVDKSPSDCKDELKNKAIASMTKIPIMLLQLICLWFDDKLQVSSRCAVYSAMLELFFSWNDRKKKGEEDERLFRKMKEMSNDIQHVQLPQYLIKNKLCKLYTYLVHELSRLAYKTLFTSEKEASMTFASSAFEEFDISDEVKTSSLKLGILSEDVWPSLCATTSDNLLFSFVHKSVQEYLAAVYIAINVNTHKELSADHGQEQPNLYSNCAQIIKEYFSSCMSLDDILEQANVFVILCGLEPQISTSISMYIYNIVETDTRVLEYRQTVNDTYTHIRLISNIQKCIINCTEEVQAHQANILHNFHVGDIIVNRTVQSESDCDLLCKAIGKQYVFPDSVRSFRVRSHKTKNYLKTVLRYLQKCQRLEEIHIDTTICSYEIDDEDIKSICGVIEHNTSRLKSLYVQCNRNGNMKPMYKTIVYSLLDTRHLVALHIQGFTLSHDDITLLCTFLSGKCHLEQLAIINTHCEPSASSMPSTDSMFAKCRERHEVDLFKHQQLQYLNYNRSVTVTRVNTSNLEIFTYQLLNSRNVGKICDNLFTANKLTQLELWYDTADSYRHLSYHSVTEEIKLLQFLYQLRELTLWNFTLTDNIMQCPSEMKSMKIIELCNVRMSLATWRQFVDSLPQMPLPVEVKACNLCIIRSGGECYPGIDWWEEGGGEELEAGQYVRQEDAMFHVKYENENSNFIFFATKK